MVEKRPAGKCVYSWDWKEIINICDVDGKNGNEHDNVVKIIFNFLYFSIYVRRALLLVRFVQFLKTYFYPNS